MPENKMGVEHIKSLLDLAVALANAGVQTQSDGHIGIEDLGLIFNLVPKISPVVTGAGSIPAEFENLTPEEAAELTAFVVEKLAVNDAHAKLVVEKGLKAIFANYELVQALRGA